MSTQPIISVGNLTHEYAGRKVLRDISLDVIPGEIIAIMGSSGGGKTTLLRCISGLIKATSGTITVDQIDVRSRPEEAREKLGLVFQSAALFDYMTVADNVLFGLRRKRKLSNDQKRELLEHILHLVGLEEAANLMPSELSGGMRKRVGLARTLAMEPKVVLYDEPTSGLDPVTAYAIDSLIVEMRKNLGLTSVVVSHDVNSVFRVADRIAFLDGGQLAFLGSIEEFRKVRSGPILDLVEKAEAKSLNKN